MPPSPVPIWVQNAHPVLLAHFFVDFLPKGAAHHPLGFLPVFPEKRPVEDFNLGLKNSYGAGAGVNDLDRVHFTGLKHIPLGSELAAWKNLDLHLLLGSFSNFLRHAQSRLVRRFGRLGAVPKLYDIFRRSVSRSTDEDEEKQRKNRNPTGRLPIFSLFHFLPPSGFPSRNSTLDFCFLIPWQTGNFKMEID